MKKVIALALALVMVLGLAVSAFAVTLEKEAAEPTEVTTTLNYTNENILILDGSKKSYFVPVENTGDKALKKGSLKVEATGCATAEIVTFDGSKEEIKWDGEPNHGAYYYVECVKELNVAPYFTHKGDKFIGANNTAEEWTPAAETQTDFITYASASDVAKALNKARNTNAFVVKHTTLPQYVKISVEDNYTAAYKEGKVTISGVRASDKETVVAKIKVISDVTIFAYEDVKEAAEYELALDDSYKGYSDYDTSKTGYEKSDLSTVAVKEDPTVVSTTAFRAIAGKGISYEDGALSVEIPAVAEGQKGVNFKTGAKVTYVTAAGKEVNKKSDNTDKLKSLEFGFKGNQVIASDFTVTYTISAKADDAWFELREAFKEKVEENDIITYYVLKDGKLYDKVTVDYKDLDLDTDEIEIVINGKAGDTLGWYTVQLTAPAEETEENPNTGAESMVGAVIALAVVSVASAAAVSLKK